MIDSWAGLQPSALPDPPRYASDATVAIFVAILLFIMPSQKPKFNFCSQTEEGKQCSCPGVEILAPRSSSMGFPGSQIPFHCRGPAALQKSRDGWKGSVIFQLLAKLFSAKISSFPTLEILFIFKQQQDVFQVPQNASSIFLVVFSVPPIFVNMHMPMAAIKTRARSVNPLSRVLGCLEFPRGLWSPGLFSLRMALRCREGPFGICHY